MSNTKNSCYCTPSRLRQESFIKKATDYTDFHGFPKMIICGNPCDPWQNKKYHCVAAMDSYGFTDVEMV